MLEISTVSIHHLGMKFPSDNDKICKVYVDQKTARECYDVVFKCCLLCGCHQGITPRDQSFRIPSLLKKELGLFILKVIFTTPHLNHHLEVFVLKFFIQSNKKLKKPLIGHTYQRQSPHLWVFSGAKMIKK